MERFGNDLTNKLIHAPTMAIRDASAEGRNDILDVLRALYDVEESEMAQQNKQQED